MLGNRFVQQSRRTPQLVVAFLGRRLLYIGVGVVPIVWVWGKTVVEGRWKFGLAFGLLWGIIPVLYRPAKGIWRMQREAAV